MDDKITVITINFKTPLLVKDCIETFTSFYPSLRYIVIDNGGCTESLSVLKSFKDRIELVANQTNRYHGPALHQGIRLATTPYVFLLDSDTRTRKAGFLELMLKLFNKDPKLLAAGWLRYTNLHGVAGPKQHLKRGMPYIHPYACLMRRSIYFECHPFIPSGAPATKLMWSAKKKGYTVASFPVEDYIWHKIGGTRGMFGGLCKVGTKAKPGKWRKLRI